MLILSNGIEDPYKQCLELTSNSILSSQLDGIVSHLIYNSWHNAISYSLAGRIEDLEKTYGIRFIVMLKRNTREFMISIKVRKSLIDNLSNW